MNDLISRQAVLDLARDICISTKDGSIYRHRCIDPDAVRELPSAQPEIIRCKDCKFWKKYGYINGKPEFLPKCGFNQIYTNKDDFCSRAERKNNG